MKSNIKTFCFGAIAYGTIECLYRGHTHWTMPITGGICYCTLCDVFKKISNVSLIKKCIIGSAIISSIEFIAGYILNILLELNVWDYSKNRFNMLGQICPLYSFLWAMLVIPICCNIKKTS